MRKHLFSLITALFCLGSLMTVQADYYVAGTMNGWTPGSNDYKMSGSSPYSLTKQMASGTYQFKVTNGSWDWSTAAYDNSLSNVTLSSNNGNIQFTLSNGSDVTFYYNGSKVYVQAVEAVVPSYTFPSGTKIYYDFTAYGSGINVYAPGAPSDWYASSAALIEVTLSTDWEITAATNLFKSNGSGWNFVTGTTLPTEGQNMIVSTDGVNYVWGTYAASPDPDPTPVTHTYTVAGSSDVAFVNTWAPAFSDNDMVEQSNGTYKWEKTNLTLPDGSIEFKVCQDHGWDVAYPSSNYILEIPNSGKYTITITFNPANSSVAAEATLLEEEVVLPTIKLHAPFIGGNWEDTDPFVESSSKETCSLEKNIAAGTYPFGVKIGGTWTANGSDITRDNASAVIVSGGSGDCSFAADIPGNYTFTWTYATNTLSVAYPDFVEYVEGLIAAIGEVTLESADAINAARTAYDNLLSEAQQAQVSNYSVLTDAEAAYETLINQIAANDVKDLIDAIPNPVVYDAACHNAILAARNGYEGLSEVQKGMVSNYSVLTAAEVAYAELTPYTVAGSSDVAFVNTWAPAFADNDMVKQSNGTYKWEKTNLTLPVGIIEFKVCEGHAWTVAYPSDNYVLNIETSGIYTITITYNPEGNVVAAEATLIQAEVVIPTVAMHGTFTGNWADTELFEKSSTDDYCSLKLNLEATTYIFGMRIGGSGDWTANGVQFTRTNASAVIEAGGDDLSIVTDIAGEYTFTWTYADNTLTIDYPALPIDANFAIDFRSNPYTVVGGGTLPEGAELIDGTFNDGQHGYRLPVVAIYITAGNYLVKMGACQYSHQDGFVKNEDGTVTYATLATNLGEGKCYDAKPAENYAAAIITIPSDQVIKVYGAEYTPYFSIEKMPVIPAFTDFEINFQSNPYNLISGTLPEGTLIAGSFNDSQHGYSNVEATVPVEAGQYRLTLGACQYGNGAGKVMSQTNVALASFNQNLGENKCYHQNAEENIISMVFDVEKDQTLLIDCGNYTPYLKLENITNVAPEPVFATDKDFEIDLRNGQLGTSTSDPTTKYLAIDGANYTYTDAAVADYVAILSAANYNGSQHGYMNLDITLHLAAGDYQVTLGACQYGNGAGAITNENKTATITDFNQNMGENKCYHQNTGENIVPVSFHLDAEQTIHVVCGNYTPYIKFENITAPQPEDMDIIAKADPQHDGIYYSTFYDSQVSYELPAGVEAYVATISGSDLLLNKIAEGGQVIPADNAVILKSTVSPYTLTPSDAATVSVSANSLLGTDVAKATPAHSYVLSCVEGVVGFYPYSAAELNPHKAYVIYSGSNNAPRRMRFIFDAEQVATGLEQISQEPRAESQKRIENGVLYIIKNGVRYNVQGQMVK